MRGLVIRYFKSYIAVPVAVLLLCAAVMPFIVYGTESRPELWYGNTVFGIDFVDSGISQQLFHRSTLATSDQEAMAISFPAGLGDTVAAPAIAQTCADTVTATSLGFFNSNFQFCPVVNVGAVPVGVGQFGKASPVTMARFAAPSLLFPEMTVEGNLLANGDYKKMASTGITLPPAQAGTTYDTIRGLSYQEKNQSATGFSAREKGLPVILSGHTLDFVATPGQINNTSVTERLWRNSHQSNALNYLYEGEAARPTWIAPAKNPYELIDCGESSKAIKSSIEMTRPGKYLTRSYWSI